MRIMRNRMSSWAKYCDSDGLCHASDFNTSSNSPAAGCRTVSGRANNRDNFLHWHHSSFAHRLLGIEPDSSECMSQRNNANPRQAPESRSAQRRSARWPRIFAQPFCKMFFCALPLTNNRWSKETAHWDGCVGTMSYQSKMMVGTFRTNCEDKVVLTGDYDCVQSTFRLVSCNKMTFNCDCDWTLWIVFQW